MRPFDVGFDEFQGYCASQKELTQGLAPWLFNLYIDPKEQYPVGHRMNAWLASMVAGLKAEQIKKYPPKEVGLEQ